MKSVGLLSLLVLISACGDGGSNVTADAGPQIQPLLPADYATTYTEVRNCRTSGDHDLNKVRILADAQALAPYRDRNSPFPAGAVVVKVEHDLGDDDCTGPITLLTVMVKEPGSTSALNWRWQKLNASRNVLTENEFRCINCHTECGTSPDGYDGTCSIP